MVDLDYCVSDRHICTVLGSNLLHADPDQDRAITHATATDIVKGDKMKWICTGALIAIMFIGGRVAQATPTPTPTPIVPISTPTAPAWRAVPTAITLMPGASGLDLDAQFDQIAFSDRIISVYKTLNFLLSTEPPVGIVDLISFLGLGIFCLYVAMNIWRKINSD